MAEYINREAAIKAVEKADYTAISSDADDCKADYLREIIESVPAADVAPVVHGMWMCYGCDDEIVTCSRCGYEARAEAFYVRKGSHGPMCGAKMDGGADND